MIGHDQKGMNLHIRLSLPFNSRGDIRSQSYDGEYSEKGGEAEAAAKQAGQESAGNFKKVSCEIAALEKVDKAVERDGKSFMSNKEVKKLLKQHPGSCSLIQLEL